MPQTNKARRTYVVGNSANTFPLDLLWFLWLAPIRIGSQREDMAECVEGKLAKTDNLCGKNAQLKSLQKNYPNMNMKKGKKHFVPPVLFFLYLFLAHAHLLSLSSAS